jgi:7,8-dihydropterin-6-yl-methyl-4-(beta-D-ribofuranosyl)aminobenzene 5'-phosphate synthase
VKTIISKTRFSTPVSKTTFSAPVSNKSFSTVLVFISLILLVGTCRAADSKPATLASSVVVTILSSNLADGSAIGEWGFSALVEVDGQCVLFDAGFHPETVLNNARGLNVDLSCVTDIVLSHFHGDHNGGLRSLLADVRTKNPDAMGRIHVAEGFFLSRRWPGKGDMEGNKMIATRKELEAANVKFLEYSEATEILPAVWVTSPITRTHSEKTYPKAVKVNIDGQWVEDYVPESQGLTVVTAHGPIVLLGCGHSGSVNLLEQVQKTIQNHSIHALMGGMHLFAADDQTLGWTSDRLRDIGIQNLMAGHCTGIEPLMRLRTGLGLNRRTAVVGAVGSRFVYGEGIYPTKIAQ